MIKRLFYVVINVLLIRIIFLSGSLFAGEVKIIDSRHYSQVFGEIRNFRVFLPPGYYDNPQKRYPVIYYYHGWSQRYFGSGPDAYAACDRGDDNKGDNIAAFVAAHDVIIVKPDGFNRGPSEEYYLRPYNVSPVETYRQFPVYFPELVNFIDGNYNTIAERSHRAISGLSMGGFMSFVIGGKYPHLVSAIGSFCGSPEFAIGPESFPVEYRHIDMFRNYAGTNVRLNFGDEDFIRFYHRDLNKVWGQVMDNYEFKIYKGAHSTCGMGEMFDFIMKTFDNPPQKPAKWDHIDVYPLFSVWDYCVSSDRDLPGYTIFENVDERGFRCSVREHLPDGEVMSQVRITVTTPPVYEKNALYTVNDIVASRLKSTSYSLKSDNSGRLKISLDGDIHEIGINKTADKPNLSIASVSLENQGYALINKNVALKIKLLNKGLADGDDIKATLSAMRRSTSVVKSEAVFGSIKINETGESGNSFIFRVIPDSVEVVKFLLTIRDNKNNVWREYFTLPVFKELPVINEFEIADGRKVTVAKEGMSSETLVLGSGNGDGIANPGESIVVLVKDLEKLWRTELVYSGNYINPYGVNIRKSDNWGSYDHVGGSAKYSIPMISSGCPANEVINFIASYWLPENPNHIIKQGRISVKVAGEDKTPPDLEWVRVPGDNIIQAKIYDGSAIHDVQAKLILKDKPDNFFEIGLKDDGSNGDKTKEDNIFSFEVPERRFGLYRIQISASDSYGNLMTKQSPDIFVIH